LGGGVGEERGENNRQNEQMAACHMSRYRDSAAESI
jgi:hypothetical protein